MRILLATNFYLPGIGGMEYFVSKLINQLRGRGHEVSLICPSYTNQTIKTRENGISVLKVGTKIFIDKLIRLPELSAKNKKTIRNFIRDQRPDVIHIHDHWSMCKFISKFANKSKIPTVGTIHSLPSFVGYAYNLPKPLIGYVEKLVVKTMNKIYTTTQFAVTPTASSAKILRDCGFKKKALVISDGVDLNKFSPGVYKKIDKSSQIILYVGRLSKEKRVDVLIKSLPLILKSRKVHLLVIGDGIERKNLTEIAKELKIENSITFMGNVNNDFLVKYYNFSDVFVMPAFIETFNMSTLEAMSSGTPIVAANASALPEIVKNGINGFLFEPDDYQDLGKKILKILVNARLQKSMALKSRALARKHNIVFTTQLYEDVYRRAVLNYKLDLELSVVKKSKLAPIFLKATLALILAMVIFNSVSPRLAHSKTASLVKSIRNSKMTKEIQKYKLINKYFPKHQ